MKTKVLIFSAFIWANFFIHAQIRSDFILTDQGLHPCIVSDKQGHLHATWDSFVDSRVNVYYALFDSLGNPIIGPYRVPESGQWPRVAVNTDYAVTVWWNQSVHEPSYVIGQLFSIKGEPVSGTVQFTNYGVNPDVYFLNDSTFIVIWTDANMSSAGILGQIVSISLKFIGNNLLLSDHGIGNVSYQYARVLSHSGRSKFMVIWLDDYLGSNKIFGRIFSLDGTPQDSSFLISEDIKLSKIFYFNAAMDSSGDFAIVWGGAQDSLWQIQWRWFHNDGSPLGPSESITTETEKVASWPCVDIAIDLVIMTAHLLDQASQ